jgi:Thioredoxin
MDGPVSTPHVLPWETKGALTYPEYWRLFTERVQAGGTSGPIQSPELVTYTRLNLARSKRIHESVVVPAALVAQILALPKPQTWLVLTELWCGDAAQNLPYLDALAQASGGQIHLRLLWRDENPELMDQFLTRGSRGIPKLIALGADNQVRFTWGPRPGPAQAFMDAYKANPVGPKEAVYTAIHTWYSQNRAAALYQELGTLLQAVT